MSWFTSHPKYCDFNGFIVTSTFRKYSSVYRSNAWRPKESQRRMSSADGRAEMHAPPSLTPRAGELSCSMRGSRTQLKRKGESGSPCFMPLLIRTLTPSVTPLTTQSLTHSWTCVQRDITCFKSHEDGSMRNRVESFP